MMLDNLIEREPSYQGPVESRKQILNSIPYALALLEQLIPMLEAAEAAQKATQATVKTEAVKVPDTVPHEWVEAEAMRARVDQAVPTDKGPENVAVQPGAVPAFNDIAAMEAWAKSLAKAGRQG